MSYVERVKDIVNNLDLGTPMFDMNITKYHLTLKPTKGPINLDNNKFIESVIDMLFMVEYSVSDKKYTVDTDKLVHDIGLYVINSIKDVFIKCSPNKQPTRTNAYKNFIKILTDNRNNPEFVDAIFNIYEYYADNTLTESIQHKNNDVHRKNIYHLLCLMEKSYGKKTSN